MTGDWRAHNFTVRASFPPQKTSPRPPPAPLPGPWPGCSLEEVEVPRLGTPPSLPSLQMARGARSPEGPQVSAVMPVDSWLPGHGTGHLPFLGLRLPTQQSKIIITISSFVVMLIMVFIIGDRRHATQGNNLVPPSSVQTAVNCGGSDRKETDNVSSIGSQPESSLQSWLSCTLSLVTDTTRPPSRQSAISSHVLSPRASEEAGDAERTGPTSARSPCRPKYCPAGGGEERGPPGKPAERAGSPSSSLASQRTDVAPPSREKLPSPSAALSEFVEGLRRKRAQRGAGPALGLEDWPALPIYQTTRASALRRARAACDEGGLAPRAGSKSPLGTEGATGSSAGLLRSSSLRCVSLENRGGASPPPEKLKTRFSSCESLLQPGPSSGRKLSSPTPPGDKLLSPPLWPRRRCLEASLDDAGCPDLGKEPLVFQNRQFAHLMEDPLDSDPFSWRLPSLNYERKTKVDFDDFLPAIRKPQPPAALAGAARDGADRSQHPGVHYETEDADRPFLSGLRTMLRHAPGLNSDSDSSSSSFKSADSVKSRPRVPRPEGDGGERGAPQSGGLGPGRSDEDVESIMKKYLQK
ncbi:Unconventional myosin-XVIIIb [Galemys pyrenaicus]|uniref:Unconventional myosin-XVIIIb n=1 Tax=Galemys pyrenaicus TaxID=202257 RepID=A0A8J6DNS1_GALPY|nr:Unconventional myosin-XVIIIb [Galemys pyrenaicus]